MRFKRIMLFLVLSFLLFETSFLCGGYKELRNIGSKFMVLIEHLDEDAKKIGLTEKRLITVTELRLRREGITIVPIDVEASYKTPYVYVNVNIVGRAYNVSLEIHEWVDLRRIPIAHGCVATIWNISRTGTHGEDPEHVISSLNKALDEFFNDYYKANPKEN